jgi:hypothetical protein
VTTAEWVLVAAAGTLASAVVGVILTRPAWNARHGAPRFVTALLGLHAGAVVVGGAVLAGAAVQSWQRHGDDPVEHAASSALIDVGSLDGDQRLYALLLLFVVAVIVTAAALLTVAARSSTLPDPGSRAIACGVLGLEVGLCGYALARVFAGSRGAIYIIGVAHLPLVIAAMVTAWPTHHRAETAWTGRR